MDRKTMIDRFEETTKQEIINHNRALSITNGSIVELTEKLSKILIDQKKAFNSFGTLYLSQEKKIKDLSAENISNIQKLDSKINDLAAVCDRNTYNWNNVSVGFEAILTRERKYDEKISDLWSEVNKNASTCKEYAVSLESHCDRVEKAVEKKLAKFSDELARKPLELVESLNDTISYRLEEHHCNYTCLRDELEIAKRDIKHLQKYIETIHTQIARLSSKLGAE